LGFYRKAIEKGEIDFPDKYFILTVEDSRLRERKENDALRTRKNFERHLRFIKPQIEYFQFLKSVDENLVVFIENRKVEETAQKVINAAGAAFSKKNSSLELFDRAERWLNENRAEIQAKEM
jgi:hypothetical protein